MRRIVSIGMMAGLIPLSWGSPSEDVELLKESNALLIKKIYNLETEMRSLQTLETTSPVIREIEVVDSQPSGSNLPEWIQQSEITASIRHRWESLSLEQFPGSRYSNTSSIHQRARLEMNSRVQQNTKLQIRLNDAREWGERSLGNRGTSTYFELMNLSSTDWIRGAEVTIGRQKLHFGDGSLIGWDEWDNRGRYFDALRFSRRFKNGESFDAFYSKASAGNATSIHQDDTELSGLWGQFKADQNLDMDVFWLHNRNALTDLSQSTYGFGLNMQKHRLSANATAAWQDGELGNTDVSGDMLRAHLNYATHSRHQHEFKLGYRRASGSRGMADTFRPLYGALHETGGVQDIFGFQNLSEALFQVAWKPQNDARMRLKVASLNMENRGDSIYSTAGARLGRYANPTGRSDDLGQEVSLRYEKQFREELALFSGFAYLNAGDATKALVPEAEGAQWFYVGSNYHF